MRATDQRDRVFADSFFHKLNGGFLLKLLALAWLTKASLTTATFFFIAPARVFVAQQAPAVVVAAKLFDKIDFIHLKNRIRLPNKYRTMKVIVPATNSMTTVASARSTIGTISTATIPIPASTLIFFLTHFLPHLKIFFTTVINHHPIAANTTKTITCADNNSAATINAKIDSPMFPRERTSVVIPAVHILKISSSMTLLTQWNYATVVALAESEGFEPSRL